MHVLTKLKGRVHSIETCGAVDGPGIRYIIFFQGCPMRCQYCHNPDTWNPGGKDAKEMSLDALMEDILRYQSFMQFSGGGVTASGGEPLMQAEFVAELFRLLKKEGIPTALDTSGYVYNGQVEEVLKYTDIVLLDMKGGSEDTFKKVTGREMAPALAFANKLHENSIPAWIRYVLVPGLTDNLKEIDGLAGLVSGFTNIEKVEILPFHKMGEYKWAELGLPYKLRQTLPPDNKLVDQAKAIFKSYGFYVN